MNTKHPRLYAIVLLAVSLGSALLIVWQWTEALQAAEEVSLTADITPVVKNRPELILQKKKMKPAKREAKGLYLTAYSAGNIGTVDKIIDLMDRTELNAVVIDIKDYSGKVLYDSNLLMVNTLKTEENRIGDLGALIKKFHEHDIYVIARQTVFQDPILAERKPEWAIKSKKGGLWRDNLGLAWVDPTEQGVWRYNVALTKEAIRLGFDEINFDYVRFPSDGNISLVVYSNGAQKRHEIMKAFFSYLDEQLSDLPAWISIDMFGFVMERYDGMSIGQRLEDAVDYVDYISPMMYPSHYPTGHLGLANPAEHPAAVIDNGMKKGIGFFQDKRAKLRPWIQAFHLGAYYDADKIRAEIDTVEQYTKGGWLLWNAANRYTEAGLKIDSP
ncbi:MAG: putative glycoside hydrolase [Candidatus Magasanikbacteria bacterium]|nr:putative glycoside hydrolase [Candidatus Magasanikbacteria bacterium]